MGYEESKQDDGNGNSVSIVEEGKETTFPERLQSLIGDGSNRKFSRDIGISYSKLHNYLTGVSAPTLNSLVALADSTGVNIEWLATGRGPIRRDETPIREVQATYETVIKNDFLEDFALIPGYLVQVSAGHGALTLGEQEPYQHLPFPRKWLRKRGFYEDELAIVWCKGDSMEPTISDSATLVVHLGRTRPIDGRIYVVRNDEQLWVKRLQVRPSAWLLLSDNSFYPPIEVPKDEQHTFEVIGQVVHISHDVGE